MLQRAFLLLVCTLTVTGCADQYSGRYGSGSQFGTGNPQQLDLAGAGPQVSARKVAILLPLTGARADLGVVLEQAAQLALPAGSNSNLDIIDTAGTAGGAVLAAQAALRNGDKVILGPLTSVETAAVAPIARSAGVNVLAFTNDTSQSQSGIWTIGVTPDQQIRRLVAAALGQGKTQFAALLPDTDFGRAMANALKKATGANGLSPPTVHMHAPGMGSITSAARDLSDYANRRGPIDAKVKAARAMGTAEGRREAQELLKTPIPPPKFNVLLLADTGDDLREIAAVLPYYDVDRSAVQVVGPALWSSAASGSSSILGAWYAAPDSNARANFEQDYAVKYGVPPPPLADLAFDAASIARVIVAPQGVDLVALTQPAGFVGADGWLAFLPDGQVRRGLAVFRVESAGSTMIEPAPQSSGTPGL
ncbi:penicillin-binding protein activator [Rhodopila sp.]|uniref:penicillin-binding protein activator n=1 Tax=Rhodopila sp. TaxID=2480087 RepID=UPI003D0D1894